MKHPLFVVLAVAAPLFFPVQATAHDGDHPPDMRVWKDAEGLFEIEGSFVMARDGQVRLLKHDGSLVWVPLNKLSAADREWVQKRVEAIQRLNGVVGPSDPVEPSETPTSSGAGSSDALPAVVAIFGLALVVGAVRSLGKRRQNLSALGAVAVVVLGVAGVFALGNVEKAAPAIQKHFEPFKDKLKFRSDADYFYVESDGLPDHPMMVGIRAWQQQVPIPQPYTGRNAWSIPLHPKLAEKPVSAKTALFRGAIALAVNGVPIFNPIKNDGRTDTFLAGELDEYGGHCGRGDDYHYHVAPVHLQKAVGKGNPIGYALDGYPLFGYTDAGGKEPKDLDEFNGRMEKDGYRYYSTKTYPYVNGGMRGVVTVRGDQIEPQPRDAPVRPAGKPLRGAKITDFTRDPGGKTCTLKYDLQGKTHAVKYTLNPDGTYTFVFTDSAGKERTETYRRREHPEKGKDRKRPPAEEPGPDDEEPPSNTAWFQAGLLANGVLGLGVLLVLGSASMCFVSRRLTPPVSWKWLTGALAAGAVLILGSTQLPSRLPWLAAHFEELDTDRDGLLTLDELKQEVERTFAGYDANKDGKLTRDEYAGKGPAVKSALAGFVKGHAAEFADKDGTITKDALMKAMTRMFEKADHKKAGKITKTEASQTGPKQPG